MRDLALGMAAAAVLAYAAAQAAVSTAGFEASLRARVASSLGARLEKLELGAVKVDPLFRVVVAPLRGAAPGGALAFSVDRARVRPSLRALLAGRAEPAAVVLHGLRLSGPVALGPLDVDARLSRAADEDRVDAALRLPAGGRVRLEARRSASGWLARLRARDLGPGDLPAAVRTEAAAISAGAFGAEVDASLALDLGRAEAQVRLSAEGVRLSGARVGPTEVGPLAATAAGHLVWEAEARRLALRDGAVVLLGRVPLGLAGELRVAPDLPFSLSLRGDRVDYAALVAALPPALAPPPAAPRPAGTLDARLDVSGPLSRPAAWSLQAALDLSRMREAARRAPPVPLRAPFVHHPPEDPAATVVVGPQGPDFVPIAELPEHVVRAVTTSEDAGFFAHPGFDFDELRNALAEGAEAGRVVRGGSTITQQLAKNLYLSQERTLARKVREAVIAVALEASVPKRRLLEIYLNVVEWGPGLHGIGPAAAHWFGKDARALTAKEAAFLASVIPNPVRYHYMFERGAPSDAWEARVNDLLFKMSEQGMLTDDQLVEGLDAPISFGGG